MEAALTNRLLEDAFLFWLELDCHFHYLTAFTDDLIGGGSDNRGPSSLFAVVDDKEVAAGLCSGLNSPKTAIRLSVLK